MPIGKMIRDIEGDDEAWGMKEFLLRKSIEEKTGLHIATHIL